jgi:hypothetical protein
MSVRKDNELEDNELEAMLTETFGPPPVADPDAWRQRRPWALACLDPQRISVAMTRRKRMKRLLILAAATAAAICVWLGLGGGNSPMADRGNAAFAAALEQIEKAKTITWKWTVYQHITSKDGKRKWRTVETRPQAYRAPGLYRDVFLDKNGHVTQVEITDEVQHKQLTVVPEKKEAVLSEVYAGGHDPRGPFEWVRDKLRDATLQWVETRKTAAGEVNVFRDAHWDTPNGRPWSYDFWIDRKTKQIIEVHIPGADIYDPETDPARNTPPEKAWRATLPGSYFHDIVLNADLDDSLFRLEPPEGYTLKTIHRGQMTEKEMADYLGVLADFNDKTFPDQVFPFAISSDRTNKAWAKPENQRTAAEKKLVKTMDYYMMRNQRPVSDFVEDRTVPKSFRYLGKGVKLGDKDRIVCWYKLKNAKDADTYRVVYGDLSVKDVAAKDLPLPVEP